MCDVRRSGSEQHKLLLSRRSSHRSQDLAVCRRGSEVVDGPHVIPFSLFSDRQLRLKPRPAYVPDGPDGLDIIAFRPSPKVTSSTDDVRAASPIVIPFGGEPLAVLLMLGCGSYALKKRGRQLSNSAKNSERNS